jgi:hypothetical protein
MVKLPGDFEGDVEINRNTLCRCRLFKRHNIYLLETVLRIKMKLSVYVKRDVELTKGTIRILKLLLLLMPQLILLLRLRLLQRNFQEMLRMLN